MTDAALDYKIGTSTDYLATFDELGIVAPFQEPFTPFGIEVDANDSLVYGHGFPTTGMRWGFISQAERNTLKTYCPGKSAVVYVRLRDDDWSYVYCKAVMIWQAEQAPQNGYILDFSIQFRILENYGASLP